MKIYDFTKERWQDMLPNCNDVCRFKYANDNHHEWWVNQEPIHVPSLFDLADWVSIRRKGFKVVR